MLSVLVFNVYAFYYSSIISMNNVNVFLRVYVCVSVNVYVCMYVTRPRYYLVGFAVHDW